MGRVTSSLNAENEGGADVMSSRETSRKDVMQMCSHVIMMTVPSAPLLMQHVRGMVQRTGVAAKYTANQN